MSKSEKRVFPEMHSDVLALVEQQREWETFGQFQATSWFSETSMPSSTYRQSSLAPTSSKRSGRSRSASPGAQEDHGAKAEPASGKASSKFKLLVNFGKSVLPALPRMPSRRRSKKAQPPSGDRAAPADSAFAEERSTASSTGSSDIRPGCCGKCAKTTPKMVDAATSPRRAADDCAEAQPNQSGSWSFHDGDGAETVSIGSGTAGSAIEGPWYARSSFKRPRARGKAPMLDDSIFTSVFDSERSADAGHERKFSSEDFFDLGAS